MRATASPSCVRVTVVVGVADGDVSVEDPPLEDVIAEVFTTGFSGISHVKLGNVNKSLFLRLLLPRTPSG